MDNINKQLFVILKEYSDQNSDLFQQKIELFLTNLAEIIDRQTAYNLMITIPNDNLSEENSDYLADVIADIRGFTARIYYKFKDDPNCNDDKLLAYVRSNVWKNKS